MQRFDRCLGRDLAKGIVGSVGSRLLLGERDFWAKNRMNLYEEILYIPLLVHDPRGAARGGAGATGHDAHRSTSRRTLLDLFGVTPPPETEGHSLLREGHRNAVIFGYFGGAVNVTDGRYTYHRFPEDLRAQEIYQYTVMPTHLRGRFTPDELSQATLAGPFRWTKQVPL